MKVLQSQDEFFRQQQRCQDAENDINELENQNHPPEMESMTLVISRKIVSHLLFEKILLNISQQHYEKPRTS